MSSDSESSQRLEETSLVEVRRFVSPTYHRVFSHSTHGAPDGNPPGSRHFHPHPDDTLISWLKENTLYSVKDPFPNTFHSDHGYIMIGEDGTNYVIHPKFRRLRWGELPADLSTEQKVDDFHYWQITLKSQPRGRNLPNALEEMLSMKGFKAVEEFKPYK